MKKLERLRPERKADSTTIDVATFGQSSTRGQPIHQAPLYAPTNNGAPECEKMANTNGRSKTTLTGSGIDSGTQPDSTTKTVYAAPSDADKKRALSPRGWMSTSQMTTGKTYTHGWSSRCGSCATSCENSPNKSIEHSRRLFCRRRRSLKPSFWLAPVSLFSPR